MATYTPRYVNTDSTVGGNGTTNGTSGTDRAFPSLTAWDAARARDMTSATGDDTQETVFCCAPSGVIDSPGIGLSLDVWVTDALCYLYIRANGSTGDRASTEWDATKYRLYFSGIGVDGLHNPGMLQLRISGLQIEGSVSGLEAPGRNVRCIGLAPDLNPQAGADYRVDGCHVRITGTAPFAMTGGYVGISSSPGHIGANPRPVIRHWNNVVAFEASGNFSGAAQSVGIKCEHRDYYAYAWNNTVVGGWRNAMGLHRPDTDKIFTMRNNICVGYFGTYVVQSYEYDEAVSGYNVISGAYFDAAQVNASTDRANQTVTFASATDYALASNDAAAKDYGMTDPSGSSWFGDDIDGTTRSAPWDIGAAEYVAGVSTTIPGWSMYYRGLTST